MFCIQRSSPRYRKIVQEVLTEKAHGFQSRIGILSVYEDVPLVHGSLPELQGANHVPLFVHVRGPEQLQRVDTFFPAEQLRNAYEILDDMCMTWKRGSEMFGQRSLFPRPSKRRGTDRFGRAK